MMRLLFILLLLPSLAYADDEPQRTVSVSGEAELDMAPDRALFTYSVNYEHKNRDEAKKFLSKGFDVLKRHDIPKKHIRTLQVSVQPKHVYDKKQKKRVFDGYIAHQRVRVTIEDLEVVDELADDLLRAGVTNIDSIEFTLKEKEATLQKVMRMAAENARQRASLLASASGAKLGEVITIQYGSGGIVTPRPMPMYQTRMAMSSAMAEAAPVKQIAASDITIKQHVSAVFALQ